MKSVSKKVLKEKFNILREGVDNILEVQTTCRRYQELRDLVVAESIKLRTMLGVDIGKAISDIKPVSESLILESARLSESVAEGVLNGDKKVILEAYLLSGVEGKLLEAYSTKSDDLGIELQKTVVKSLIESVVAIVEACKKKKNKKKKK